MSAETTPLERATEAVQQRSTWPSIHWGMKKVLHPEAAAAFTTAALTAALSDPDLGVRISNWRQHPCEHSRILNPKEHRDGDTAEYEQACSPCLRDRLVAYLLGGAS